MPVSTQHELYEKSIDIRQLVRDCVSGEQAIKSASKTGDQSRGLTVSARGTKYLPVPNPSDNSAENLARYDAYRDRASFKNYTAATLEGLRGMAFRRPPIIDLPDSLDYLNDNATGDGLNLSQLAQFSFSEVCAVGGMFLLVDCPNVKQGLTLAEKIALNARAFIKPYTAESLINWRETIINGQKVLELAVLKEEVSIYSDDEYEPEKLTYHRVLLLEGGVYKQRLYNEDDELVMQGDNEEIIPLQNGKPLNHIPLYGIGAENNDFNPDKSPLLDIANLNIAHYRNSADYEESSFISGQPTLAISGLTQTWLDDVLGGNFTVGSRGAIPLPVDGDAKLLQAEPNQMPRQGMLDKQSEMISLGARIIQDSKGNETAEAAKIRFAGQNSKLAAIITNIEIAIQKCIEQVALFEAVELNEYKFELNKQFYDASVDPQLIAQQIQMLDRNVISMMDFRDYLRRVNLIAHDRTDEEIDDDTAESSPI